MRSSIHLLSGLLRGLIGGLQKLQGLIDGRFEVKRSGWATAQMSGHHMSALGAYPAGAGQYCASSQLYLNGPCQSAIGQYAVEVDEGRAFSAAVGDLNTLNVGSFAGIFDHDGKPRIFRWDDKRSCYVPIDESSPGEAA
jgi:hypothetical protein